MLLIIYFFAGIRRLQCILLKICLILGVQIHVRTSFIELVEPSDGKLISNELLCSFFKVLQINCEKSRIESLIG